jgi:hypothetical protein
MHVVCGMLSDIRGVCKDVVLANGAGKLQVAVGDGAGAVAIGLVTK